MFIIVIILYNPNRSVLKMLDALSNFNKIIIDNSDIINQGLLYDIKQIKNCTYKNYSVNMGIAKSLNNAAREAIEMGYSHIVSLDQDSELDDKLLNQLWDDLNSLKLIDNIATFSPRHIINGVSHDDLVENYANDIFGLQSANFINLSIWKKINGFNEELFIDMVDTEYYIRAKLAGYSCITCNKITMQHHVGENVKELKIFGKYIRAFNHSPIRKYYQARNFLYVYFKYRRVLPEVKYFLKVILVMPISILIFESDKLKKLSYYCNGMKDFLNNRMGKLIE